jgi:hypothetical protein
MMTRNFLSRFTYHLMSASYSCTVCISHSALKLLAWSLPNTISRGQRACFEKRLVAGYRPRLRSAKPLTRRLCGLFALSVWSVSGHITYFFSDEQEKGEEPSSASLCRFLLTIRSSLADSVQEILLLDIASSSSIGF